MGVSGVVKPRGAVHVLELTQDHDLGPHLGGQTLHRRVPRAEAALEAGIELGGSLADMAFRTIERSSGILRTRRGAGQHPGHEQKAAAVLLALLSLGIKKIRLGPTLPAFISPAVLDVLIKEFDIKATGEAEEDIAAMMAGN